MTTEDTIDEMGVDIVKVNQLSIEGIGRGICAGLTTTALLRALSGRAAVNPIDDPQMVADSFRIQHQTQGRPFEIIDTVSNRLPVDTYYAEANTPENAEQRLRNTITDTQKNGVTHGVYIAAAFEDKDYPNEKLGHALSFSSQWSPVNGMRCSAFDPNKFFAKTSDQSFAKSNPIAACNLLAKQVSQALASYNPSYIGMVKMSPQQNPSDNSIISNFGNHFS